MVSTTIQFTNPIVYTIAAWFRTTVASGKKIVGFESSQFSDTSTNGDRELYVGADGKLYFGVFRYASSFDWGARSIASTVIVTDGLWHYAVGTFSTTEVMTLYLDGVYQSTYTENAPQSFSGWWRIGSFGFGTYNWGGNPSDGYFPGDIVAVQVYSVSLTAANVTANYRALMANGTLLPNSVFCPIGTIANLSVVLLHIAFCDVIAHVCMCVFLTI